MYSPCARPKISADLFSKPGSGASPPAQLTDMEDNDTMAENPVVWEKNLAASGGQKGANGDLLR